MKTGLFTTMIEVSVNALNKPGTDALGRATVIASLRNNIEKQWAGDSRPYAITFGSLTTTTRFTKKSVFAGELWTMQALVILVNPLDAEIGEYVELHPNPLDDQPKPDSHSPYYETRDFELTAAMLSGKKIMVWERIA